MIRPWRLTLVVCLAAVALLSHAGPAGAQEDPTRAASARTLFEWQSTPEFPMEFGIGGLAHDDGSDGSEAEVGP